MSPKLVIGTLSCDIFIINGFGIIVEIKLSNLKCIFT